MYLFRKYDTFLFIFYMVVYVNLTIVVHCLKVLTVYAMAFMSRTWQNRLSKRSASSQWEFHRSMLSPSMPTLTIPKAPAAATVAYTRTFCVHIALRISCAIHDSARTRHERPAGRASSVTRLLSALTFIARDTAYSCTGEQ